MPENGTYLAPYIRFNGRCREAMEFYQTNLGGSLYMQTFEESGITDVEHPEHIMSAQLISEDGMTIMGTDGLGEPIQMGNNISLTFVQDDAHQGAYTFELLSEGGRVEVPLQEQPWGGIFGSFTDKFGINWMFNLG